MIIGNKKDILTYKGISEGLDKAIEFLFTLDADTETGKYEIDGENVYCNVFFVEPKAADEITFEAHRKYIDLHYILDGSEIMGYAHSDSCIPTTEYFEADDYFLLEGEAQLINVNTGDFYIVHPFDAHAPGYGTGGKIKKAVLKIKV